MNGPVGLAVWVKLLSATSHEWPLTTGDVASKTEKLNF